MEAKRLNFNRPLLSARRYSPTLGRRKNGSSISPSTSRKSELHSSPLRDPGTVPFVWEQVPGTPKHETKTEQPPVLPNRPPRQFLNPKKQDYDAEKSQVTYGPNFITNDDKEDNSDFGYDEHENMSFKSCGLLPYFCLRGSICMLNPTPQSSVTTNRTRVGSSSAISQDAYENKSSVKQQNNHGISDNIYEASSPFPPEVNTEKKGLVSFKELLAYENEKEAEHENPAVEKTLYVVDIAKPFESDFKENDVDVLGISRIPFEPSRVDLVAHTRDHKVDQRVMFSQTVGSPAPPPLPNSPLDSWLWRTLPSMNPKTSSLFSNHKLSSKETGG